VTAYLSGPMRGYEHYNFPAFRAAEEYLVHAGWKVISPARKDAEEMGLGWEPDTTQEISEAMMNDWMRRDITDVAACSHIVLLPGWEESTGAKRELQVAQWCGLEVFEYNPNEGYGWRLNPLSDEDVDAVLSGVSGGVDSNATVSGVNPAYESFLEHDARRPAQRVNPFSPWAEIRTPVQSHADAIDEMRSTSGEVRSVNPITGGEKGVKPARFDLIPAGPLTTVATHYGIGAQKYEDRNWERGYEFSKTFAALQRHAWAWWNGEDIDPETGSPHMAAVVFHAFAALEFANTHPEMDDRP
jgi:hypothetical protein